MILQINKHNINDLLVFFSHENLYLFYYCKILALMNLLLYTGKLSNSFYNGLLILSHTSLYFLAILFHEIKDSYIYYH